MFTIIGVAIDVLIVASIVIAIVAVIVKIYNKIVGWKIYESVRFSNTFIYFSMKGGIILEIHIRRVGWNKYIERR